MGLWARVGLVAEWRVFESLTTLRQARSRRLELVQGRPSGTDVELDATTLILALLDFDTRKVCQLGMLVLRHGLLDRDPLDPRPW